MFIGLILQARTVVRSGGLNFDWDERFQLDLLNNMEVEFLIYSWDPQLRHRLCYRTSLRLGNLFGMNQRYHQIALRLHPAGVVYLTVRYTQLSEAYNRYRVSQKNSALAFIPISHLNFHI